MCAIGSGDIGYMDRLEYRIQVSPGANPHQIIMETGAENLTLNNDGSLTAELSGGTLDMSTPHAWQTINGEQVPVVVSFKPLDNGQYTFTLGAYDPMHAVTIDPILSWSTYLAGSGNSSDDDYCFDIAVDAAGCAYVTGSAQSAGFPVTQGAFDESYNQVWKTSSCDLFITKFNADGSDLVYSTFLGGSGADTGYGIALDGSGCAYVTGHTESSDFPVTSGSFDTTYESNCCFIAKLSADGSSLVFSTLLGGRDSSTFGNSIAVDDNNCAYVTGSVYSSNFPVTPGVIAGTFETKILDKR